MASVRPRALPKVVPVDIQASSSMASRPRVAGTRSGAIPSFSAQALGSDQGSLQ
jgi:hypothetical protein